MAKQMKTTARGDDARTRSMSLKAFSRALSSVRSPKRTLVELCSELPFYGVGARVYRQSWVDNDYDSMEHHYRITSTNIVSEFTSTYALLCHALKVITDHARTFFHLLRRTSTKQLAFGHGKVWMTLRRNV